MYLHYGPFAFNLAPTITFLASISRTRLLTGRSLGMKRRRPRPRRRSGRRCRQSDDLPQYKFAREIVHLPVAGGSAESRYLTTVYGMIKSHLHESAELHLDLANRHGIVDFYVNKSGTLVGRTLVSSSGSPNLYIAVMAAITEAAPYPAPPNWRTHSLIYNFGRR